ncbi:MAG: hypothetical protein ABIH11_02845 [Candidatus Altiarchaeota archaeon]
MLSAILSLLVLCLIFALFYLQGFPDILLVVVGAGFLLGLAAVYGEVHSLDIILKDEHPEPDELEAGPDASRIIRIDD